MLQIAELILHGVTLRSRLPRKGLIGVAIFTSRSMAGCGGDSAGIRRGFGGSVLSTATSAPTVGSGARRSFSSQIRARPSRMPLAE